jgi:acyl CoA:acetate/3-ketoacid CoA transferase beta subunit
MAILNKNGSTYNIREYLAFMGARLLENKKSVFVGTGLPVVAAMLAQKTHAPDLMIVFEAGGMGPLLTELPVSVGESRTFHRALMATSMHDIMSLSQQGYIDYGLLGAAQMDMYGNLNTTVIGNHAMPKVRLPGSGGAADVASFSQRLIIIAAKQSKATFVNKVDFLTSPGYLSGPGAREKVGLPRGTGPYRVVTQLGLFGFNHKSKRLELITLHPGIAVDDIRVNSSFEILIPESLKISPAMPREYLKILRDEIDPAGIVLGKD